MMEKHLNTENGKILLEVWILSVVQFFFRDLNSEFLSS